MKVIVDLSRCDLHGLCVEAAPEVFEIGDDGARVQIVVTRDGDPAPTSNMVPDSAGVSADRGDDNRALGLWRFQTATVTLASIVARTSDGELVDLDMDLPVEVDVVRIEGGKQLLLPDGILPADTYDQVVLVITAVRGELRDGTVVTIQPPGGGWTSVIPICPLEVADDATTTIGIALNVRGSFLAAGNGWSFHPRFRSVADCDEDDDHGDS